MNEPVDSKDIDVMLEKTTETDFSKIKLLSPEFGLLNQKDLAQRPAWKKESANDVMSASANKHVRQTLAQLWMDTSIQTIPAMIEAINKAIDGSSSEVAENLFGPASFL
jgi:hypothetical protein